MKQNRTTYHIFKRLKRIKTIGVLMFLVVLISCSQEPSNLKVATIFGDNMVLQQEQMLPIWGTASPNTEISVQINNTTVSTKTNASGQWKLTLPKQHLGPPTKLIISTKDTLIEYSNILIGEVWLASGQSNMHLDMSRTLHGKENAQKANNPLIRIYNMKPTYPTGKGGIHTKEELKALNTNQYFHTKGWVSATPKSIEYFSAIAYYFAEKLQNELKVPIGIIHNAVPGSPTESWIAHSILKQDTELSKLVNTPWKENEKNGVGKVLLDIAKKQVSLSKDSLQKHPWMPTFCYENGIFPIKEFAMKGIIWYQGESNAGNPVLHEKLLQKMVTSWRNDWKQKELPFYYVQLTSREDRPTWPAFRDSQRRLLDKIPNTGMVVITDVGDRQDTHAKRKKPVGERLALLALGKTYHKTQVYESPLFNKIERKDNELLISFKGATKGLKTSDNKDIRGFEIGRDSTFVKVDATISGEKIKIKVPSVFKDTLVVRYAWKSYTKANLVNSIGLPVSTFSTELTGF